MTEVRQHRRLRKGAFRTQEADLERLLLRKTRGHDFAKKPQYLLIAQRSLVACLRAAQYLRLALGLVEILGAACTGFRIADELRKLRPLIDERMDLLIDRVDAGAHGRKVRGGLRAARARRRCRAGCVLF